MFYIDAAPYFVPPHSFRLPNEDFVSGIVVRGVEGNRMVGKDDISEERNMAYLLWLSKSVGNLNPLGGECVL